MKKSQILAALALAFALGVVAPAAGSYAYIVDNAGVEVTGSAQRTNINNAIIEAKDIEDYNKYEPLVDLVDGDEILTASLPARVASKTEKDATAVLSGALIWGLGQYTNVNVNGLENTDIDTLITMTENAIASNNFKDTSTGSDYTNLTGVLNGVVSDYNDVKAAVVAQIKSTLNANFGYSTNHWAADTTMSQAKTNAKAAVANYGKYSTLINATQYAEEVVKSQATGGEEFSEAEAAAALIALNNAIAAFGVTTPEDPTPINPDDNQGNAGDNQGNTQTPTTPSDDEGKGEGQTPTADKNGAPNTGVVAEGADASAKSSVSIMAGISSFITAAGSALVAIRRGKRA